MLYCFDLKILNTFFDVDSYHPEFSHGGPCPPKMPNYIFETITDVEKDKEMDSRRSQTSYARVRISLERWKKVSNWLLILRKY